MGLWSMLIRMNHAMEVFYEQFTIKSVSAMSVVYSIVRLAIKSQRLLLSLSLLSSLTPISFL